HGGVTARILLADDEVFHAIEGGFLAGAGAFGAERRQHAIEHSARPLPLEERFGRQRVCWFGCATSLDRFEVERDRPLTASPLLRALAIVFVRRKILERCQQKRSKPAALGIGDLDGVLLEKPR